MNQNFWKKVARCFLTVIAILIFGNSSFRCGNTESVFQVFAFNLESISEPENLYLGVSASRHSAIDCCAYVTNQIFSEDKVKDSQLISCLNNTWVETYIPLLTAAAPYVHFNTADTDWSRPAVRHGDALTTVPAQGPSLVVTIVTRATSDIYSYAAAALLIQAGTYLVQTWGN